MSPVFTGGLNDAKKHKPPQGSAVPEMGAVNQYTDGLSLSKCILNAREYFCGKANARDDILTVPRWGGEKIFSNG